MREIRFRVWDTEDNKMIPVFTNYAGWKAMDGWNVWHDDRYIKLQYTGLKDNKGVEIYEGDILKYNFNHHGTQPENEGWIRFPVIYKEQDGMYFAGNCGIGAIVYYGGEVVGNVYENPELLGGD